MSFEIESKYIDKRYTVYDTREHDNSLEFLVYEDDAWKWIPSFEFKPASNSTYSEQHTKSNKIWNGFRKGKYSLSLSTLSDFGWEYRGTLKECPGIRTDVVLALPNCFVMQNKDSAVESYIVAQRDKHYNFTYVSGTEGEPLLKFVEHLNANYGSQQDGKLTKEDKEVWDSFVSGELQFTSGALYSYGWELCGKPKYIQGLSDAVKSALGQYLIFSKEADCTLSYLVAWPIFDDKFKYIDLLSNTTQQDLVNTLNAKYGDATKKLGFNW